MSKQKSIIGFNVDSDIKKTLQQIADEKDMFLSELIRKLTGWESVEIYPKKLNSKYDKDLLMSMAVSELVPSNIVFRCDEIIEKLSDPKKIKTIEWVKMRYSILYEIMKSINLEFQEQIESQDNEDMARIFEAFAHFVQKTKKNKDTVNNFEKVCYKGE